MRRLGRTTVGLLATVCLLTLLAGPARGSSLPAGFRDDVLPFQGLEEPTAIRFAPDGRVFVAQKAGRVLVYSSVADPTPTVFADLRADVYNRADRGLLGLALDPEFFDRPYVYLLYTYDHVLGEAGGAPKWADDCSEMPGDADVDDCPVSGRLVRLTAAGDHAVEAGGKVAQQVLVVDWCQQFSSHSIGDLQFDASGALYASGGDGASFYDPDFGQFGWPQKNQCGDPPSGVGATLTPPSAEGGALRAQDLRTLGDPVGLDGSLIRIDPDTGQGLPGNPMFGSLDPNARRIVAYGFRNPFRFALDPESEEIYVGNVGWNEWEEVDRIEGIGGPLFNSGWPCYEGPEPNPSYENLGLSLCEDLYAAPAATAPPLFVYRHGEDVVPGDGCSEDAGTGSAVSGIVVYHGDAFPAAYDGALFFADPVRGCIYVMQPGGDGRPDSLSATTFLSEGGLYPGVDLEVGPEGNLYYVKIFGVADEGTVHRISHDPNVPVAKLTATPQWGLAPLAVKLDASASTDPNGEPLSFEWDLDGNGSFETTGQAKREKTFTGSVNRTVTVRVEDDTGLTGVASVTVYPGDTPPQPEIEAPAEGTEWGVGQEIGFAGSAPDDEQGDLPEADLDWKVRLYHCPDACHAHPLQVFPGTASGSFTAPDHDYPVYLEISLTATDSRGLSATQSVAIYPRTVDLAIETNPPGLTVGAGLLSQPAPFTLRAIEGSRVVLAAPESGELAGAEYAWSDWSDGGARVHTVLAQAPGTYVATYTAAGLGPTGGHMARPGLRRRPPRSSRRRSAAFAFSSATGPGALFRCALDDGAPKPCDSPKVYRRLALGGHSFQVVAVDPLGEADDSEPTSYRWRVLCPRRRGTAPAASSRSPTRLRRACARSAGSAARRGR